MENELKTNAVKLSPDEQYQIRKSIVRLSKTGKTNGEIYDGQESDIRRMTNSFLSILSDFLPLEEIGEEEKLNELLDQDKKNGKFGCNVYMDYTD